MPDQTIPVMYPNTTATTTRELDRDRQAPHSQSTHPSTTAHDPDTSASQNGNAPLSETPETPETRDR
jgi:hypothetical protein